MGLDILTPKGRETVQQEAEAVELFLSQTEGWEWKDTSKGGTAIIDGLLFKDGVLQGVVETKCRSCELITFQTSFRGEWLITMKKIEEARSCAALLHVPLFGFLYLTPSKILLTKKITSPDGDYVCKFRVDQTETQRTCNGGTATRANAFIDMSDARQFIAD